MMTFHNKNAFRLFCLLLGVASMGAGTAWAQRDKAQLRIGAVLPLTGSLGKFGSELLGGARLAIEDIKKENPGLGARLILVKRDDHSDVKKTEELANALVSGRKADIFLGSVSSAATLQIIRAIRSSRKPLVAPAATHQSVTGIGDFVFRTCFADAFEGRVMAQFLAEGLKKQRAGIIYESSSLYSQAIAHAFKQAHTAAGGTIAAEETYTQEEGSLTEKLLALKKQRPEVLIAPSFYKTAKEVMRAAYDVGLRVPIVGSDGWNSPKLFDFAAKKSISGHFFVTHFSAADPDPKVKAFVAAYQSRYGHPPGSFAAMGYDSMLFIAKALQRANTRLARGLTRALADQTIIEGLSGKMRLDDQRNAIKSAYIMTTTGSRARYETRLAPQLPTAEARP